MFLLHPDEVDQGALNLVPGTNKSGSKLLCEGFIAKANRRERDVARVVDRRGAPT